MDIAHRVQMGIGGKVVIIHAALAARVKHASKITAIVTNAKLGTGETVAIYVIQVVIISVTIQRVIVFAMMGTIGILIAKMEEFALRVLKTVNIIHVLLIPGHANTVALVVSGEIIATSHVANNVIIYVHRIQDTAFNVQQNQCMAFTVINSVVHTVC